MSRKGPILAIAGVNDLLTMRPDVASQWHPRNELRADQVPW